MKQRALLLLFLFVCITLYTQAQRTYVPERGSEERTQQMEAIHKIFDPLFPKQPLVFSPVSESYLSNGQWAFMHAMVFQKNGKPVDFSKSEFKTLAEAGQMDSNGINVLFRKERGVWKIIRHVDFPTDVSYGCWWKEYKAPKDIFPYTEKQCN